jgi:hypothetical protein
MRGPSKVVVCASQELKRSAKPFAGRFLPSMAELQNDLATSEQGQISSQVWIILETCPRRSFQI